MTDPRVLNARHELRLLECDQRLIPAEHETCRRGVLGDALASPKTLGEAKRLIAQYKSTLHIVTTEVPM